MAETELASWITILLPSAISAIIAFIILGLKRFTRASDDTVVHAVTIRNIEKDIDQIEKKFDEVSNKFNDVWKKLGELKEATSVSEWRLRKLESNNGDNKKSPV